MYTRNTFRIEHYLYFFCIINNFLLYFIFFGDCCLFVLEIELRASCLLSRYSITEYFPGFYFFLLSFFLWDGAFFISAWLSLNSASKCWERVVHHLPQFSTWRLSCSHYTSSLLLLVFWLFVLILSVDLISIFTEKGKLKKMPRS